MIWTLAFWKGAAERSIKTFAQALAAYFVVGTTGLLDLDWGVSLSVAGAAALASLLTSVGNAEFTAGKEQPQVVVNNTLVPEIEDGTGAHRATPDVFDHGYSFEPRQ